MSTNINLPGPGPRGPGPELQQFIGALDWSKLPADRRLALWRQWQASQGSPQKSEADRIARELETRYGDAITAESKMTAMERLRFAHASGPAKPAENPDATPVPPDLLGERKLEALMIARQRDDAQKRLQGFQRANDPFGAERVEREIAYLDSRLRGMRP